MKRIDLYIALMGLFFLLLFVSGCGEIANATGVEKIPWDIRHKVTAYWKFNEEGGYATNDCVGNYTMTPFQWDGNPPDYYAHFPGWAEGMIGNAMIMGNTHTGGYSEDCQLMFAQDSSAFNLGMNDFTFAGWIKYETTYEAIVDGYNISQFLKIRSAQHGDGRLQVAIGGAVYDDNELIPLNKWIFVWLRRRFGRIEMGYSLANATDEAVMNVFKGVPRISFMEETNLEMWGRFDLSMWLFSSGNYPASSLWVDNLIWCQDGYLSDIELEALYNKGKGTERLIGILEK
ncbi:hypothetical protein ACFL4F_01065 [Candidatus Margulisiibacteriota bacterium]